MARKLKTYQTSLGFFDQAIAAPSMKAALEAWGAKSNLFHQGVAKESSDPDVIAATMSKPGVILRRPVGSSQPFTENAELPKSFGSESDHRPGEPRAGPKKRQHKIEDETASDTVVELESERRRRESEQRRRESELRRRETEQRQRETERRRQDREKARMRRERAVAQAQAEIDKAEREHKRKAGAIEAARAKLDRQAQAEETRWQKQREKLEAALRRARG